MSEKIKRLSVVCEPEFSAVCSLLGEGQTDVSRIKKIYNAELAYLREIVKPIALWGVFRTKALAVLLTVGEAGEQYVRELFAQGEHLRALVADAMLSAWLFAMDVKVQDEIRVFCDREGVGVAGRLVAPDDLLPETQREIAESLDAEELAGIRLTDAHMLVPEKSMCYVLKLCSDRRQFAAGHDCARCEKKDCTMRQELCDVKGDMDLKDRGSDKKMIQIVVEDQGKKYVCEAGSVLIDTLREYGVRIDAPCGGSGRCGKCRVRVVSGELPVTAEDRAFLSEREIATGVRLACTARPVSDLRIRVLAKAGKQIATATAVHTSGNGQACHRAMDENGYGIAVDIGTTTLAACIYGWSDGVVYETVTAVNSGRDFGADVLSRMEASCNGKRSRLQELIQEDVRALLAELMKQAGVQAKDVQKIVIAANMTMVHLLMGYSCETLGRAPFVPANKRMIRADAMRILGDESLRCPVIVLPAVSAFVGGDIVSGMLALGMDQGKDTVLLLDVGTNGEMVLRHNGQLYVTSTAAGPAFEGGGISCGCASVPGAICSVKLTDGKEKQSGNPDLTLHTIGDAAPVGICGSGVLELVSELLQTGLLDETGLFVEQYRENGFPLAKTASGEPISFTQGDVRALQLAKGAIRAGIEVLLTAAGVQAREVRQIYLAGGFGVRMDEHAAITIGLLPEVFRGRIRPVGNSSLSGAVFAGKCGVLPSACEGLLAQCRQVVLAEQPEFEENYLKYMGFHVCEGNL